MKKIYVVVSFNDDECNLFGICETLEQTWCLIVDHRNATFEKYEREPNGEHFTVLCGVMGERYNDYEPLGDFKHKNCEEYSVYWDCSGKPYDQNGEAIDYGFSKDVIAPRPFKPEIVVETGKRTLLKTGEDVDITKEKKTMDKLPPSYKKKLFLAQFSTLCKLFNMKLVADVENWQTINYKVEDLHPSDAYLSFVEANNEEKTNIVEEETGAPGGLDVEKAKTIAKNKVKQQKNHKDRTKPTSAKDEAPKDIVQSSGGFSQKLNSLGFVPKDEEND